LVEEASVLSLKATPRFESEDSIAMILSCRLLG
jgi:hypothetical protein